MRLLTFAIFLATFWLALSVTTVSAKESYSTGVVHEVMTETEVRLADNQVGYFQLLKVVEDGTGVTRQIENGSEQFPLSPAQRYRVGQKVILSGQADETGTIRYIIIDQYRIPVLVYLILAFFVLVIGVSRIKGFTSILGMIFSLAVLMFFMVPQIANGANPVLISILAAGVISAVIIYLGHGFNYRSHVALFCMLVTLSAVGLLSHFIVQLAYLSGTGEETAGYLQFVGLKTINLQGLFLGGIILAALSVLDDSVVSQVSILYQLKQVKQDISLKELFKRGMSVGKDHISTLVNTLVLAYAGASLPLFILFTVNSSQPAWVSLNDQLIAEEVVRTLTGSMGLVLSIPLSTLIAAYVITHMHKDKKLT